MSAARRQGRLARQRMRGAARLARQNMQALQQRLQKCVRKLIHEKRKPDELLNIVIGLTRFGELKYDARRGWKTTVIMECVNGQSKPIYLTENGRVAIWALLGVRDGLVIEYSWRWLYLDDADCLGEQFNFDEILSPFEQVTVAVAPRPRLA